MLYDIVDFPVKFQIWTVRQIVVCFTCGFFNLLYLFLFLVFRFHMLQCIPVSLQKVVLLELPLTSSLLIEYSSEYLNEYSSTC